MIKKLLLTIEQLWVNPIREEQKQYNKPIILNKNDGSDWRRELI